MTALVFPKRPHSNKSHASYNKQPNLYFVLAIIKTISTHKYKKGDTAWDIHK